MYILPIAIVDLTFDSSSTNQIVMPQYFTDSSSFIDFIDETVLFDEHINTLKNILNE